MHTACFALPHDAIRSCAEPDFRTRSEHLSDERRRSAGAQVDTRNAAVNGRAEDLVEQRAAAPILVLERKDAAVREHTDRKTSRICQTSQAKVAVARCCEVADARACHVLLSLPAAATQMN